jgi:hypothetical protein
VFADLIAVFLVTGSRDEVFTGMRDVTNNESRVFTACNLNNLNFYI